MEIIYHQINVTNKELEIELFKNLQNEEFLIIGIEVTDIEIDQYCSISIDPQHSTFNTDNKITAIEYIFNHIDYILDILKTSKKVCMLTVKPDSDSLGAMALLTLFLKDSFKLDGDMILRLKAIAKSDRHGRINWKNKKEDYFQFENYNIYGLPCGLSYMTSDKTLSCQQKVDRIIEYLLTGEFKDIEKYNGIVNKNFRKASKSIKINIIVPDKLCIVESKYRGAVAFGYRYTPCVIAKNKYYTFGNDDTKIFGKKMTIAQYENKYMDMITLLSQINELEPGWGGSAEIIGSPIDRPCKINEKTLIKLCKNNLY